MKTEQDWVKEWREDSSLNRWSYDELELEKRIKQIQLDAQKHGEQIGWRKGISQAAGIIASKDFGGMAALKQQCVTDILSAIDNKTNL